MPIDEAFLEQRFSSIVSDSLSSIFEDMLNIHIEKKGSETKYGFSINSSYGVAVGIVGDIVANVLFEFEPSLAEVVTGILSNKKKKEYDNKDEFYAVLKGVLSEIGNIVSGNAIGLLAEENIDCDITPPFVYYGNNTQVIPKNQETLYIHFVSNVGNISINLVSEVKKIENV